MPHCGSLLLLQQLYCAFECIVKPALKVYSGESERSKVYFPALYLHINIS
uniref:Copper transport protein CCH-like n=1 Tax=Rhizophora mucronata TaxID=61149 RepID=A0A2P2KJ46_RHIMU